MVIEQFARGRLTAMALEAAAEAHYAQKRKAPEVPYIIHPVRVMFTLLRHGITDDEYLAAALLHDVVEDTRLEVKDLAEFGPIVQRLVADVTELKTAQNGAVKRPWKQRKQHCIHMVRNGMEWPAVAIKVADQIDNLLSTWDAQRCYDMESHGADEFWEEFGGDEKSQYWYSRGIYQAARVRLKAAIRHMRTTEHDSDANALDPRLAWSLDKMLAEMSECVFSVFGELARDLNSFQEDEDDEAK